MTIAESPPPPIAEDLARVFQTLDEAVFVSDALGRYVFVNAKAAKMLGFGSPEELLGTRRAEFLARFSFHDESGAPLPPERLPFVQARTGKRLPPTPVRVRMIASGQERFGPLTSTPLLDAEGQVRHVVTLFREVTQQHRSEKALRLLSEVSALLGESLDYQGSLQALVQRLVPELADWAAVEVFDTGGRREVAARAHADPSSVELVETLVRDYALPPEARHGSAKVLRTGIPDFVPLITDDMLQRAARDERHLALLRTLALRSIIAVPLTARGGTLGVLSVARGTGRPAFDETDLALATELASRAAQAVDNARLYERAQSSLKVKDQEARTSEALRRLGASIASELDPIQLAQRIIDEATAVCGAGFGAFFHSVVDEKGGAALRYSLSGVPAKAFAGMPTPRQASQIFHPTFANSGPVRCDDVTRDPRYGKNPPFRGMPPGHVPVRSYLAVSVVSRAGEVVGGLFFGHVEPGVFTADHERLATDIAAQAAVAVENARLFRQLRNAQESSRSSEERLRLALDAGRMGYFDWDLTTGQATSSPRMIQILGIPPESYRGTFDAFLDRVHPEDREKLAGQMIRMVEQRLSEDTITYRAVHPDGAVRWVESHTRLVRDPHGVPIRSLGVALDITERTEAAEKGRRLAGEQAARTEAEAARRRIAAILDSIGEPLFALDRDWRFRFINVRAEQLLRKQRDDVLGRGAWEEPPFRQEPALLQQCERALVEGSTVEFEAQLPDGRWYELRASPFDEGISIYLRDITARRREQDAQKRIASYDALRADVSVAVSGQGELPAILQRCSEAMIRHLGVDLARIWTIEPQADCLELQASAGRMPDVSGPWVKVPLKDYDFDYFFPDRKPYWTNDLQGSPYVRDKESARQEGFVAFARYPLAVDQQRIGVLALYSRQPLTEDMVPALSAISDALAQGIKRHRAEQQLEARAAELVRSNTELEQFAYVASHDLQEPLRMVASYTQLLARRYKGRLDPDADQFIQFAVEGVTRMKRLIGDLLAYSRVGTRGKELAPTPLAKVMNNVLVSLGPIIEETGAEVTVEPLPAVLGDETQLEQLFQNLLGNALKFKGGSPPRVVVSAEAMDRKWVFSVRDNGIGIDPQYFQRIFVIFQRLHGKDEYPGTGIGLAICKKIVERHGGRIWVESVPGEGATFYFTLPTSETAESAQQRSA
jgi:PAS domain S-box-containing protein